MQVGTYFILVKLLQRRLSDLYIRIYMLSRLLALAWWVRMIRASKGGRDD